MTIRTYGWHALVLLALWPLSVLAASSHIVLPGGDELWLTIPAAWNQKFDSPLKDMPAGAWLTPRDGASFNVLITPLSGTPVGAALSDDNKLRAIVTSAARDASAKSVEMTIPIHDLTGPDARGFYFFATDRAPKPGEWKYLTQGMIKIDGTPFAFTILTNDGQEAVAKTALELIRNASCHSRTTT
ncbi:MAG TPA: hypothetical protein VK652_04290 [Steroidobacteraceae bacterium]|nr:hypothetical protein [Steroidobacteraceae bacterium]